MWSLQKTHQVGELVAAVAVVLSLVFVGYEIQQNSREQRRMTTQTLAIEWSKAIAALYENPELACVYLRGSQDFSQLSNQDRVRFSALIFRMMRVLEEFHLQFEEGSIDPSIWAGFDRILSDSANSKGVRTWWEFRKHWFSEPFQHYVDERLAAAPLESQLLMAGGDCL